MSTNKFSGKWHCHWKTTLGRGGGTDIMSLPTKIPKHGPGKVVKVVEVSQGPHEL